MINPCVFLEQGGIMEIMNAQPHDLVSMQKFQKLKTNIDQVVNVTD